MHHGIKAHDWNDEIQIETFVVVCVKNPHLSCSMVTLEERYMPLRHDPFLLTLFSLHN